MEVICGHVNLWKRKSRRIECLMLGTNAHGKLTVANKTRTKNESNDIFLQYPDVVLEST
jgi:hypothetical protein